MIVHDYFQVKINDLVIISGSGSAENPLEHNTLIVDLASNFSMRQGPDMLPRNSHSCGSFNYKGKIFMIVAGGFSATPDSTQIWDPYSNDGWIEGYKIKLKNRRISN